MKTDKSLPKTQCVGCVNYSLLLDWYKNEEMPQPQCCKHCAKKLVSFEL